MHTAYNQVSMGGQERAAGVQELLAGVWSWERRPRGIAPGAFGGRVSYAITVDEVMLLIDPLVEGEDDPVLGLLDTVAGNDVRILITMPFHTRSAESLWCRYRSAGARIYGHSAVKSRLKDASGFETVSPGATIEGLAHVHSIGLPPRSEQPIEIPSRQALVFGDAVVETGDGELRVWEESLDSERRRRWWRERYRPTLHRLADLDVEHVLVTHGRPIIGSGGEALRHALQRDPWQRPKR